jgi:hypothetical protein
MSFEVPQIFMQPIGIDFGDEAWMETTETLLEYISSRLVLFEFSDHCEKIDQLRIALFNQDRKVTDLPSFVVGQKFLVAWGWKGRIGKPREMIVSKRDNNNPYVVWLRDPTIMLAQRKNYYQRSNITDSEWVRQIAEEWGYSGSVARITETTQRREITQPRNRTDAAQLHVLAKRNGFEFYIDADGLYWGPRQLDSEPIREYIYRRDLAEGTILDEPDITQNTDRGAAQVIVKARDPLTKDKIEVKVSASTAEMTSLGAEIELDDPDNSPGTKRAKRASRVNVRAAGYMTEDEAKSLAQAIYRDNVQGMYRIKMTVMGDSDVTSKRLFSLSEHSRSFDGLWYIREARHIIRPGSYRLELNGDRDALAEVRVNRKVRRPISNPYQGQKTSEVAAEEETTPEGLPPLKRKLVVIPGPDGTPAAAWMLVENENDFGGQTSLLSPDEIRALDERTLRDLTYQGVQSVLPDV